MDLNRIPNSRDLARLRYEESRRETLSESQDRVRDARAALARLSELRAQRLRNGREAIKESHMEATRQTAHHGPDEIEISDRARIMAGKHEAAAAHEDEAARLAKLHELKIRYHSGELHSKEAFERAAHRLLGGE